MLLETAPSGGYQPFCAEHSDVALLGSESHLGHAHDGRRPRASGQQRLEDQGDPAVDRVHLGLSSDGFGRYGSIHGKDTSVKISPHAALILPHHELGQAYPFDVFAVERRVLSEIRARFIEPILAAKTTAECERLLSDAGFLYGAGSRYVAMSYARSRGAEAMEEDLYRWVDFWITAPTASGWERTQRKSSTCRTCASRGSV